MRLAPDLTIISSGRDRWAARICETWQRVVVAIITTGQLLIEAKADLPHGEWLAMIESGDLPFSDVRTVERFDGLGCLPRDLASRWMPGLFPERMG
jgi:hypothetical protein